MFAVFQERSGRQSRNDRRSALTAMDVILSLSIISVLLAVCVPAVQRSRERSRQLTCNNNLRQLGVASQNYVALMRDEFPYTATNGSDAEGKVLLASVSPHRKLLPFLVPSIEVPSSRDGERLVVNNTALPPAFEDSRLQDLLKASIPVFLCPSDVQRPGSTNYRANMGCGPGIYGPSSSAIQGFIGNVSGAFVHGRSVRSSEFRDGLSTTVLFCEKRIGDGNPLSFTAGADFHFCPNGPFVTADDAMQACALPIPNQPLHASYCGWTWLFGGWNSTWYNHILTPNSKTPDCSEGTFAMAGGGYGAYCARSYHPDGVNVLYADGSTSFVNDSIDLLVWRAMSTRRSDAVSFDR